MFISVIILIGYGGYVGTVPTDMVKPNNEDQTAGMLGLGWQMGEKFGELKKENAEMKEGMEKMKEEIVELKEENVEFSGKMREMERKIEDMSPTKQIDGNEWMKYDWKNYKWNAAATVNPAGEIWEISDEGFTAKHLSSNAQNEFDCIPAMSPIPKYNLLAKKPAIGFYYEVEILNMAKNCCITVGFSSKCSYNSIGIWRKNEIWIDGFPIEFENPIGVFKRGDVIGIGIIHQPNSKMECFTTYNGKLLGKVDMPAKFVHLQLFPTVDFNNYDHKIRGIFDMEKWSFKEFKSVLE